MEQVQYPGAQHPYAPMCLSELARFVHVPLTEVARWIAEGLPQTAEGLVDPFVCSNWLCAGRLERCPALARRWRTYLLFFAPFLAGEDRVRRVHWRRSERLYLPHQVDQVAWWLPRAATSGTQRVESEEAPQAEGCRTSDAGAWWCITGRPTAGGPACSTSATLTIAPQAVLAPGSDEHAALAKVMEEVVGTFRYEYRHHRPWEYSAAFSTGQVYGARSVGSCLDCTLAVGAQLTRLDRPWRVLAGMVADSRIANPHFWIEVDSTAGWVPLDPTLPAIVRMVGGDWRAAVRAWTGACDARRVSFGVVGRGLDDIPGGATVGSAMGEVIADGRNAWPCLGWVCGDCESEFSER